MNPTAQTPPSFQEVVGEDIDEGTYMEGMKAAFQARYERGTDRWTDDEATVSLTRKVCALLQNANLLRPSVVVDIGCGKGGDVARCAQQGFHAVGIDLVRHDDWIDLENAFQGHASFVADDFAGWAGTANILADAVVDNGCLHHQHPNHLDAYLAAVHRTLVPHGIFAASLFATELAGDQNAHSCFDAQNGKLFALADGRLSKEYSEQEIVSLLTSFGFHVHSIERVKRPGYGLDFLHVIARKDKPHVD